MNQAGDERVSESAKAYRFIAGYRVIGEGAFFCWPDCCGTCSSLYSSQQTHALDPQCPPI